MNDERENPIYVHHADGRLECYIPMERETISRLIWLILKHSEVCNSETVLELLEKAKELVLEPASFMMQEDVAEILVILGLGDHGRPESPHQVVQGEIIPAIKKLKKERDSWKEEALMLAARVRLLEESNKEKRQ